MEFNVGPVAYRLVVSDRAIFDEEGNELEGCAHEARRLLLLSLRVEPGRREEVALHELCHAYAFHFPPPRDEEERAQLFATAAKQFRMDLERQGGAEAIVQLPAVRVPHLGRPLPEQRRSVPEMRGQTDRIVCACCEAEVMCGSIANGQPVEHQATGQWRIERWTQCEACDSVTTWWEACSPDGTPLGQYVANPPPRLLRGREALRWLAERSAAAI